MASHIRLADHVRETRIVNERLVFAGIFSVLLFSVVIGRLAILQVMEYEHFDSLSAKNRVDINPLPPQRGLIYDRNGVLLAENIPTFSLELTPEKVSDLEQTLAGIAEIFELSDEEVDVLK
jgi:penicillin-binding protein 2